MNSPVAQAIAALETEKANLLARVGKVDEAIANLRDLFHLPADQTSAKAAPTGLTGDIPSAIRSALARGPLPPRALADAVNLTVSGLRPHIRALEAERVIVSTGTTGNRRIALAPAAAAKEAL